MPGNGRQLRHQERSQLDRPRALQRQLEKKPFPLILLRAVPGKMTPKVCDLLMFNAHRAWHPKQMHWKSNQSRFRIQRCEWRYANPE
jgi:hypothetical protein